MTPSRGILAVVVFVVAAVVLLIEARLSPFEIDESGYIWSSRYFAHVVLRGDVTHEEWDVNYWTLTQPPMTRYIVGAWLTAHGYDLFKMNKPYVPTASSYEINVMKGRVPTDEVLWRARQPLALLGAGSIGLLFLLGARIGGTWVGLVTAALALSSAFIRYTLVHVWAEGPLAFFLVLSVLLATRFASATLSGRRWLHPAVGLALAVALATSVKLTGVVGIVALGGWAAAVYTRVAVGRVLDRPLAGMLVAALAIVTLTTAALWVLVNPFLWREPIERTRLIVVNRAEETAIQQAQFPEYAVHGWAERPWLTISGSLQIGPLAETPLAALVNLPLLALGFVALAHRRRREAGAIGILLAWAATYFVVIVLGLGLNYPRYFMPTTLLFSPVVALGLVYATQSIWHGLPRALGRPQPAA